MHSREKQYWRARARGARVKEGLGTLASLKEATKDLYSRSGMSTDCFGELSADSEGWTGWTLSNIVVAQICFGEHIWAQRHRTRWGGRDLSRARALTKHGGWR